MADEIRNFAAGIAERVPGVAITFDGTFIDLERGCLVVVEFRNSAGWGVSLITRESFFGEGHDRIFGEMDEALACAAKLLLEGVHE